ncbi:MAG: DUF3617 family protein [Pseudomonadota bacterium]
MNYAKTIGCGALALALAACGGTTSADADGDGEITSGEAQAAMVDKIEPQPGKYKSSSKFIKAEGLPKEAQSMMEGMMSTSFEYCLTEEMTEGGFEEMMTRGQDDGCTVDKMDISGNDIDMAITCPADEGETMTMAMKGEVTSTSSDYKMTMSGMTPGMGKGTIEVDVKQERIGDCD